MFITVTLCQPKVVRKDFTMIMTIAEEFELNPDKYAVMLNTDTISYIYQKEFAWQVNGKTKKAIVTAIRFKDLNKVYVKESFDFLQKILQG